MPCLAPHLSAHRLKWPSVKFNEFVHLILVAMFKEESQTLQHAPGAEVKDVLREDLHLIPLADSQSLLEHCALVVGPES